jgi:uncharacterized protein (TIGR00369 family)
MTVSEATMVVTPESLTAAGWELNELGGFTAQVCPLWSRREPGRVEVGMIVEERHTNNHIGTLHGGAVMTFADVALGWAVSSAIGHNMCVTLSLQTQFVSVARIGEFVTCEAELVRATKSIVFVRGLIMSGDRIVSSAEGMWKVMDPNRK